MTRRFIALTVLAGMLGLPLLAGCESKRERDDDANIKIDTEGRKQGITVKGDDD